MSQIAVGFNGRLLRGSIRWAWVYRHWLSQLNRGKLTSGNVDPTHYWGGQTPVKCFGKGRNEKSVKRGDICNNAIVQQPDIYVIR